MTSTDDPIELLARCCAQQAGATRDNTFGPETDVYRVGDKIFAMVNHDGDGYVTLKADPEDVLALCEQHDHIRPGYYMNKRHWLTIDLWPGTALDEIPELVTESYDLVLASLTKAQKASIEK